MAPDRLVYMANQIGKFFATQGSEQAAVAGTLDHLRKFWDPRMREAIVKYLDSGGDGLDANVRQAVEQLRKAEP